MYILLFEWTIEKLFRWRSWIPPLDSKSVGWAGTGTSCMPLAESIYHMVFPLSEFSRLGFLTSKTVFFIFEFLTSSTVSDSKCPLILVKPIRINKSISPRATEGRKKKLRGKIFLWSPRAWQGKITQKTKSERDLSVSFFRWTPQVTGKHLLDCPELSLPSLPLTTWLAYFVLLEY